MWHGDSNYKMQCIQYNHDDHSVVKLTDPLTQSKHYAVAVDIFDERNKDIFMSFMNVLSRDDSVSLITFGLHSQTCFIHCKEESMRTIHRMFSRKEEGLNILVGMRALERVKADVCIMITAGYHDSAPRVEFYEYLNPRRKRLKDMVKSHNPRVDVDKAKRELDQIPRKPPFHIWSPGASMLKITWI